MFSANENIALRQNKKRITTYVEATIPEKALEMGTSVMVMQVSCKDPGCVPLETVVTIVFPRPPKKKGKKGSKEQTDKKDDEIPSFPEPLVPGLTESQFGGSYQTRILKPLSEVTKDDVLDALPPSFTGGRRTVESVCLKARDVVLAQINQIEGTREGKKLIAEYLKVCLDEYVQRGCVAPEWGEPFPPLEEGYDWDDTEQIGSVEKEREEHDGPAKDDNATKDNKESDEKAMKWGEGNVTFKRPIDDGEIIRPTSMSKSQPATSLESRFKKLSSASASTPSTHQKKPPSEQKNLTSQQLLQQMSKSEHVPGIRRQGCPCCDPDAVSTYVDNLSTL